MHVTQTQTLQSYKGYKNAVLSLLGP